MPIRAFEICTATLVFWINIPATASFVCNQRPAVRVSNLVAECCILLNGLEAISDGECRALEFTEGFGEIVIGVL